MFKKTKDLTNKEVRDRSRKLNAVNSIISAAGVTILSNRILIPIIKNSNMSETKKALCIGALIAGDSIIAYSTAIGVVEQKRLLDKQDLHTNKEWLNAKAFDVYENLTVDLKEHCDTMYKIVGRNSFKTFTKESEKDTCEE